MDIHNAQHTENASHANAHGGSLDVSLSVHRRYYVEIKCQLEATDAFFIADLIACSTCFEHHYAHHQELKSIIHVVATCGI